LTDLAYQNIRVLSLEH